MNMMNTAEALNTIREVLSRMDPAERERALKYLRWYGTGRITVEAGASCRGIRYEMESKRITACILGEADTDGLIECFAGIEKRHWMDD